jgi:arylsulfatase B
MHWPEGGLDQPIDIDRLTNHFDLLPTLIDLCSLETPTRGHLEFDGRSLVPLLRDARADWPDRTVFMHVQNVRETPVKWLNSVVMTEQWRLIQGKELYDMRQDPGQTRDVANDHPDVVADLRGRYERHWDKVDLASNPYARPIVGSAFQKDTWLAPDAWILDDERRHTWDQGHVRAGVDNSGFWPIEIAMQGLYEFEVRRWPREIDLPVTAPLEASRTSDIDSQGRPVLPGPGAAIAAVRVELVVGDEPVQTTLDEGDVSARFRVSLPAGPADVRAWLIDAEGSRRGAYYIYIRKTSAL